MTDPTPAPPTDTAEPGEPGEPAIETRHDEAAQRYEVLVDGQVVGFADHRDAGEGVWSFPHTVTEPAFEGRGLANRVVTAAMADVRERGLKVVPSCSYVAHWFEQHPDEQDLLA